MSRKERQLANDSEKLCKRLKQGGQSWTGCLSCLLAVAEGYLSKPLQRHEEVVQEQSTLAQNREEQ